MAIMSIFFMIILVPLVLLCCIGVPIIIGIFVYRDASKREDCSPWLWTLVAVFVPSFMGVIVYLIVRRDYPLRVGSTIDSNRETSSARYSYDDQAGTAETGTGFPTWGKVLIIIGAVVIAICVVAGVGTMIYSVFNYGTNVGIDYHGF